jgi:DNA-directed RNA polymerase specialized sigma24 family protein
MDESERSGSIFAEVPFEELMANRFGGDPELWEQSFEKILAAVVKAISRKFGDLDLASDAAISAMRTFIRRVRVDGRPGLRLEGPRSLEALLVVIALRKAIRHIRSDARLKEILMKLPTSDEGPSDLSSGIDRDRLRFAMSDQLERMLEDLKLSIGSEMGRKIVREICLKTYQRHRVDDEEIAARAGCSVRTVGRLRREVEVIWPKILEQGRQAIQELEDDLRSPES